jgi:hypothetical protein
MTAQQGSQNQTADPGQMPREGGLGKDAESGRDSAHAAGSPGTTEAAAGIPQQAGRVEEAVETPVEEKDGLAGQVGSQPGGGNSSEVKEQADRIEEHPEDQNSG